MYPGLRGLAFPFAPDSQKLGSPGEFHLHPHYRGQLPIEATLLKTQAGLDQFVTEKYQDRIAGILADWSAGLLAASQDMRSVEKSSGTRFFRRFIPAGGIAAGALRAGG